MKLRDRISIFSFDAYNIILQSAMYIFIILVLYMISHENFLLFHSLAEIFSIAVAFSIFIIAWNLKDRISNNYILFVGYAFLFIAFLDVMHTIAYKGINIFPEHRAANLATQLWISARFMQALTLLAAPFFIKRQLNHFYVLSLYTILTGLIISTIFFLEIFPVCYIEGVGLTGFKIVSEFIISFLLLLAIFSFRRAKRAFDKKIGNIMLAAIIFTIFSEICFTFYETVYGDINFLGHIFKIIAFYFFYRAIVSLGLKNPFDLIFRELQYRNRVNVDEIEFIKAVLNTADVLVVVLDPQGRVIFFNKKCENLTGYSAEEVKGIPYWDIFIKRDELNGVKDDFFNLASGEMASQHENYWICSDGRLRLISWLNTVLYDKKKKVNYIVSTGIDVTALRHLEDENRKIIDMLAHDMRSPLVSLQLLSSQLIKKWENFDDEKRNKYLNFIREEGARLNEMIDEFIEFSLMKQGLLEVELKPVNAGEIFDYIHDLYSIRAKEKGITLSMNNSFSGEIMVDEGRLKRVFANLLDNAVKFTDEGGVIDINIRESSGNLSIEIADSGAGIPDADIPFIFHPYRRGRKEVPGKGFGVGLAYVKSVVNMHNGIIDVKSREGHGSSFVIRLPVSPDKTPAAGQAAGASVVQ